MKIAKVVIENFRHIERKELDFTDSLGRVRDMTLIVGPNTCGKTTILDALAIGPGWLTGLQFSRPNLIWSPSRLIRYGTLNSQITYYVRFSQDEIEATRELFRIAQGHHNLPNVDEVKVTWKYPDPRKQHQKGLFSCEPRKAWDLFKGRFTVASLLSRRLIDWEWFKKVGGVFTFDQQRTGMGKTIPQDILEIIEGHPTINADSLYTTDSRKILLSLAVKSSFSHGEKTVNQFDLIKERYAEICSTSQIKGVKVNELNELDIIFDNGKYEYGYDGLSSGEQMLLLFSIRMVTENIHQSLVLIDELELHQHPIWQSNLFYLLPKIGANNQFIVTTHSAYLQDVVFPEAMIDLGALGDQEGGERGQ